VEYFLPSLGLSIIRNGIYSNNRKCNHISIRHAVLPEERAASRGLHRQSDLYVSYSSRITVKINDTYLFEMQLIFIAFAESCF
jgi:hypothetical protein